MPLGIKGIWYGRIGYLGTTSPKEEVQLESKSRISRQGSLQDCDQARCDPYRRTDGLCQVRQQSRYPTLFSQIVYSFIEIQFTYCTTHLLKVFTSNTFLVHSQFCFIIIITFGAFLLPN